MYIKVRVTPDAKADLLEKIKNDTYKVSVRLPAEQNLANGKVRELIAQEFKVSVGKVRIINGHHSPSKILSVDLDD